MEGGELRVISVRVKWRKSSGMAGSGSRLDLSESVLFHLADVPAIREESALQTVGWERNSGGKLLPERRNLSDSLDPQQLVRSSVELNLRLMRWRLQPALDLSAMSSAKCLLFGAGTLGSNVARLLLAWGVHQITLVDHAVVSFSNPVRQSLYTYTHAMTGRSRKVEVAVDQLRLVHPAATIVGHHLSVPMPGHSVATSEREQVRAQVATVERLIAEHDILFLLFDTREARWLPTLLGASMRKVCLLYDMQLLTISNWIISYSLVYLMFSSPKGSQTDIIRVMREKIKELRKENSAYIIFL